MNIYNAQISIKVERVCFRTHKKGVGVEDVAPRAFRRALVYVKVARVSLQTHRREGVGMLRLEFVSRAGVYQCSKSFSSFRLKEGSGDVALTTFSVRRCL